ncbi:MAG: hypothetical protein RIS50_1061, partial [Bacteroidota bacterium]
LADSKNPKGEGPTQRGPLLFITLFHHFRIFVKWEESWASTTAVNALA